MLSEINMDDDFIKINKITLLHYGENINGNVNELQQSSVIHNLTLRKKKIDNYLLSKRKLTSSLNLPPHSQFENTSSHQQPQSIALSNIITSLTSNNVSLIINTLRYIKHNITFTIEHNVLDKRTLFNNEQEIINHLCKLLLYESDTTVQYEASLCLVNVVIAFPFKIEKCVYSDNNLECLFMFLNLAIHNECLFKNAFVIITSACAENEMNQQYFIRKNIINVIYPLLSNMNTLVIVENKDIILKCLISLSSIIKTDINYAKYFYQSINTLQSYFTYLLTYPNELHFTILLHLFKRIIHDKATYDTFMQHNFISTLTSAYNICKENNNKKLIVTLILNTIDTYETLPQCIHKDNLFQFIFHIINNYKYENRNILNKILFTCSNLCYDYTEELFKFGVLEEIAKIAKMFYDNAIRFNNDKESIALLKECLFVIFNSVCEGSCNVKEFYGRFDNGVIGKFVYYAFEVYDKEYELIKVILGGVICLMKGKGVIGFNVERFGDVLGKYKSVDKEFEGYIEEIEGFITCD